LRERPSKDYCAPISCPFYKSIFFVTAAPKNKVECLSMANYLSW
jgi:hypothetical protein